ncbi:unnamed protein product [Effrenium voratum]|nr:unnamed protein product [Effrenium voratum]
MPSLLRVVFLALAVSLASAVREAVKGLEDIMDTLNAQHAKEDAKDMLNAKRAKEDVTDTLNAKRAKEVRTSCRSDSDCEVHGPYCYCQYKDACMCD